jgi:hypothetical protein
MAAALAAVFVTGQAQAAAKAKWNPRALEGVWMNDNTLDEQLKRAGLVRNTQFKRPPAPPPERPLTLEYQKIDADQKAAAARLAEGAEACNWPGAVTLMTYPYPFEILQTKGRITLIFEADSQVRRIFLDRKEHLPVDDLDPSYNGDSIGHWEGDVLVVDTIGFNEDTKVRGMPHSEELHLSERFQQTKPGVMEVQITATDPKAFTKPVVIKVQYSRRPDWRIREYSCNENNRDAPDASGQRAGGVAK